MIRQRNEECEKVLFLWKFYGSDVINGFSISIRLEITSLLIKMPTPGNQSRRKDPCGPGPAGILSLFSYYHILAV